MLKTSPKAVVENPARGGGEGFTLKGIEVFSKNL